MEWYWKVYEQVLRGFGDKRTESVHSSLLLVRELLKHTGNFMLPRFREVCRHLMELSYGKNKSVRIAIIQLLPELADYCPQSFARWHIASSIDFLLECSRTQEMLPYSLLSIGRLCKALGKYLVDHHTRVEQMLGIIKLFIIR